VVLSRILYTSLVVVLNFVQRRTLVRYVRVEFVESFLALLKGRTKLLLVVGHKRVRLLCVRQHVSLVRPSDLFLFDLRILRHCYS
jgi:hypothetical protein